MSEAHNTDGTPEEVKDQAQAGQGEDDELSSGSRLTPGKLLSDQRETLELTVQQVANRLNLTMHYIQALESDRYDKLPGDIFVRGYIRSYAGLLSLDPEQVIALYEDFSSHKQARKEEAIKRIERRRLDKNRPWVLFSGFAFVAVAATLWLFSQMKGGAPQPPDATSASGAIGRAVESSDPVADDGQRVLAAEALAGTLDWDGDDRLELQFSDESWVEIEHRGGPQEHQGRAAAGDLLVVEGTAPFSVLLGNAQGVTLRLNDHELDISANIRADGSARLSLGI